MPKHRRSRSVSPFPSPSSTNPSPTEFQQYDEIRCPVCMDHPHNAVLLLCASHDKGCRPFLCDTSRRHSNCLDQYRKSLGPPALLSCPLCRGLVSGSRVLPPARARMNSIPRSCSTESCPFLGNYTQLRKHARTDHPLVRPSNADPARERDWRTLERERDLGDLISTLRSGFEEDGDDGDGDFIPPVAAITFFLVLRFRGSEGIGGRRPRSWRRGRVLWGESVVDAEAGDDGDDGDDGGGEEGDGERRGRRRLRMLDDVVDGDDVVM